MKKSGKTQVVKTGPKTAQGKEAVSKNAVRHGLRSPKPVVSTLGETLQVWSKYRDTLIEDLAPVGAMEEVLAERVALLAWRLRRIVRHEAACIASGINGSKSLADEGLLRIIEDKQKSLAKAEGRLELILTLAQSPLETPEARIPGSKAFDIIENGVEDVLLSLHPHGTPEGITDKMLYKQCAKLSFEEIDRRFWTHAELQDVFKALEEAGDYPGQDGATLLECVADTQRKSVRFFEEELEKAQNKIEEAAIPGPEDMERITRYEAALSRQMYQALHELEASQKRRRGEPTPMARVDVSGLGEK
jgi:hypothetical protein